MSMRPRWKWVLALGLLFAPAARAAVPEAAKLVGPDALIYAEFSRPEMLIDRVSDKRLQEMVNAVPGYAQALQGPQGRQLREGTQFIEANLNTTWDKALRDLMGGGLVFAVEGKEKAERIFLIVSPKDDEFLERSHAKLLELARQDAEGKGNPDPVKQADHRGITAYSFAPTEAHAVVEGRLIVANGGDALKVMIDRVLDEKGGSIVDEADWKEARAKLDRDAVAWGFARLDRMREIDPKRFQIPEMVDAGATFLFGAWIDTLRKAPWISASLTWTEGRLGAEITLPNPPEGRSKAVSRMVPPSGSGALAPLNPPGTIASLSLWRDFAAIWEVRADLLPPEALQGLAQLDTTAGTFFGGRDFGTGVLGSIGADWRLVIAQQDPKSLDPMPEVKLPAFALVVSLKPEDREFADRLAAAFQSFVGLANLGAAQTKAPPLMLGSEMFEGVTISTSKFLPPRTGEDKGGPVHQRHNFSPSSAIVDNQFILSSSLGLARDLVKAIKSPAPTTDTTLTVAASGEELAKLVELNKARLISQNMIQKGNDKAQAESETALLGALARYLGQGKFNVQDDAKSLRFRLNFQLESKP